MKPVREYFKNTHFILFLICLFALCFRLWLFFTLQPWDEKIVQNKVLIGDSHGYYLRALSIINTQSLSGLGSFRLPGYMIFLASIYFLFGVKPWAVLLLQVFLDIGIVIIVYFIAKEIFKSETVAFIAAILYSISFPSAYYSIRLLTETLFTFIFALAILIFIKGLRKDKLLNFALTGFLIGLSTLVRPVALYIPALLFFVLLFSGSSFIIKLRNMLLTLILFFITISPWQLRNLNVYGHYALTSKHGKTLCSWNAAIVKAGEENISRHEARDQLIGNSLKGITNPFEESKVLQRIAFSYISKHPLQYMKYHLKGTLKMFLGTSRSGVRDIFGIKTEAPHITEGLYETARKIIGNLQNELPTLFLFIKQALEYLFAIIGLITMRLKNEKVYLLLLIAIILYFAAITGPIGYSRFRIPIIPFYLTISAKGIFETFKFVKNRR